MFEPVVIHELDAAQPGDQTVAQRMAPPLRAFIFNYVDQVTKRLAAEFGCDREGWLGDPADPAWHDPDSVEVVRAFIAERAAGDGSTADERRAARAYTERALERFCDC